MVNDDTRFERIYNWGTLFVTAEHQTGKQIPPPNIGHRFRESTAKKKDKGNSKKGIKQLEERETERVVEKKVFSDSF